MTIHRAASLFALAIGPTALAGCMATLLTMDAKESTWKPKGAKEEWVIRIENPTKKLQRLANLSINNEPVLSGTWRMSDGEDTVTGRYREKPVQMRLRTSENGGTSDGSANTYFSCEVIVDGKTAAQFRWSKYSDAQVAENRETALQEALDKTKWQVLYLGNVPLPGAQGYPNNPQIARGIALKVGQSAVLSPHRASSQGVIWGTPTWRISQKDQAIASVQRRYDNRISIQGLAPGRFWLDFFDSAFDQEVQRQQPWVQGMTVFVQP